MDTRSIHYFTQQELHDIFSVIEDRRDKALVLTAYTYGLRASEIGMLRREDIDFERLKIRIQRVKNSITSEYPLRPEVAKAIKRYLRTRNDDSPILFISRLGNPISRRTLYKMMQKYGQKAGTPKKKREFHALKHSIAVHMLDAEADVMFVKDWLGHKSIQNTGIYAQLTDKARRVFASPRIVGSS